MKKKIIDFFENILAKFLGKKDMIYRYKSRDGADTFAIINIKETSYERRRN